MRSCGDHGGVWEGIAYVALGGLGLSLAVLLVRRPAWGPPTWRLVAAALGTLWLAGWAYVAGAGERVTVPVLRNDEGYCDVRWPHGEHAHTAEVECDDEAVGDPLEIVTMPPPFSSEAADVVYTPWYVAFLATVLFLPLALWPFALLRRRRRPPAPEAPEAPEPEAVAASYQRPTLEAHELRYSTIAAHLERRAAEEEWRATAPPRRLLAGWRPEARTVARGVAYTLWPLSVALIAAAVGRPALTSRALDPRDGVAVPAVVDTTTGSIVPFKPDDVTVDYVVAGREVETTVTSTRELDGGETVTVLYDPQKPSRARLAEHDGTTRGVGVVAAVAVVAACLILLVAVRTVLALAALRRLRREEPRTVRYVASRGPFGEIELLVFASEGDPAPELVVPVEEPLPDDVPFTGTAVVRGLADRARPLVTIGSRELRSPRRAWAADTEELLAVVDGHIYSEDYDP